MATLAATATHTINAAGFLFVALTLVTVGYGLSCWLWPFGTCRRCKGSGKRRSPFGRSFALCRRCDGDGRCLRVGRRIINALREIHDKSS
ncbi:hypothetical protein [Actinoplanes sp. NPDC049599]|uniref:hypothetical protein n=1 Tax=Actinoplanes sp. NPDC049599 TaxID=3363903 RepID=UPI0037B7444E